MITKVSFPDKITTFLVAMVNRVRTL